MIIEEIEEVEEACSKKCLKEECIYFSKDKNIILKCLPCYCSKYNILFNK